MSDIFIMPPEQQQAFYDATGGVTYLTFNHIILFLIGIFVTIWFLGVSFGIWAALRNHKVDFGDAMFKFAISILVYICVGSMIFFHG